jgi:carbonic anhydrase
MTHRATPTPAYRSVALGWAVAMALCQPVWASDPPAKKSAAPASPAAPAASAAARGAETKNTGEQVLAAVEAGASPKKRLTLVINGKEKKYITVQATEEPPAAAKGPAEGKTATVAQSVPRPAAVVNPKASRQYIRAKAAALAGHTPADAAAPAGHGSGDVHWSYEGDTGPQAWGNLKPEFSLCRLGKRQSPINIDEADTLQGPAEPLQFNYQASDGSVVNNGHTIQVDVTGDNTLTVRGSVYKLLQFHFHTPSEERINYRSFAMVAHLVHRNNEGQLAVVAVLLETGVANELINRVWTHMPLDSGDRVRLPSGLIDLNALLPKDQRYYQFFGSLTTPPCTEGVLWMVLKQPTLVSRDQIRLFTQLFPNNARPVQPVNARPVRSAK